MLDNNLKELDILLTEHRRLGDDIQRIFNKVEKIAGFWLVIMSSIFGVALKEDLQELFLIIPPLFLSIFFYLISMFEFIMITGGHAAALEIRINKLVGAQVLRWESQLTKRLTHNRLSYTLAIFFSVLISLGIMFFSIYLSFDYYPILSLINSFIILFSLPFIVVLFIKMSKLHLNVQKIVLGFDINK